MDRVTEILLAERATKRREEEKASELRRLYSQLVYLSRQSLIGVDVLTDRQKALRDFIKENEAD